jgi:hypothetical protein
MFEWVDTENAALALLQVGQQHGIDLSAHCSHSQFLKDGRYIHLHMLGEQVRYSMQGPISLLPSRFSESSSAFNGMWHETGILPDMELAFVFVKAWLWDAKEVDDLPVPEREITRCGIG